MQVLTAKLGSLKDYVYTVIFARYNGQWLYCRAKERSVFETAGGKIEPGETPLEGARRELFEETGAVEFDIEPAFDYSANSNGQVFFAQIYKLDDIPDFKMAEIGLFDGLPDNLRFPEITPVLFAHLLTLVGSNPDDKHMNCSPISPDVLHARQVGAEIWDIYDADRRLTGRIHRRRDPLPPGDYHLVVLACLMNSKGEFLITKRAPNKSYAGMWEFQGGCAVAGDDSLTAAVRESKEEVGLELKPENGELVLTLKLTHAIFDIWLFVQDFDIEDVVLQPCETVDAKYATMDEIRAMIRQGEFHCSNFIEDLFATASKRLKG